MSEIPKAGARRPRVHPQKVPPFARYKGTSAWTKYRKRVRMYAWFKAEEARKQEALNASAT